MDELRTEHFNDQYDKIFNAELSMQHLRRVFTAHTEADCNWIARRNAAMQAAWRSLSREFPELRALA
jgi:hypothetical protein